MYQLQWIVYVVYHFSLSSSDVLDWHHNDKIGSGEINEVYEPRQRPAQGSIEVVLDQDDDNSFSTQAVHDGEQQVHQEESRDEYWTPRSMKPLEDVALTRLKSCRDAFRFQLGVPFPNTRN